MISRRGLLPPPSLLFIACWSITSLLGTAFGVGGGGIGGGTSTSSSTSTSITSSSSTPTTAPAPAPPPSSYTSESIGGIDGRYSFSLTTFDPTGTLRQVRYATRCASSLGTPLLATYIPGTRGSTGGGGEGDGSGGPGGDGNEGTFVLVCPMAVPSPLVRDDGTSRFVRISDRILATHTGIGADGRCLLSLATKHAVEHEYAYDESVPIGTFLEELSGQMQRYTMKPGVRPFGCSILVAHLGGDGGDDRGGGRLYRVDPSGAVETVDVGGTAVLGRADVGKVLEYLDRRNRRRGSPTEDPTSRGEDDTDEEGGQTVKDDDSPLPDEGGSPSSPLSSSTIRFVRALMHGMTEHDGRGVTSSPAASSSSSKDGGANVGGRKHTRPRKSFLVATFSRGSGLTVETRSLLPDDDDDDGGDR